jgi:hypothetical protein
VQGSSPVLGLSNFRSHVRHLGSELRGALDGRLGIHPCHRLPHGATRKKNSANVIDLLGQLRSPISRENRRHPEQSAAPDELFLRRSNGAGQNLGGFAGLKGLIETEK